MITITISDIELYDNSVEEFVSASGGTFAFEHSLWAISLWESEWKKPFLNTTLTNEESLSYYMYMCLDRGLTREHLNYDVRERLGEYMKDLRTATTFQNDDSAVSRQILTSEVVYSLMAASHVPFECERWNFNRLMALLRVISANNTPAKKMSRSDTLRENARLNAERKKKYNTKG